MPEKSMPERRPNPEAKRTISGSLQNFFMDLKEYSSSLTEDDVAQLSRQFTPEVDSYVRNLIDRMEKARKSK